MEGPTFRTSDEFPLSGAGAGFVGGLHGATPLFAKLGELWSHGRTSSSSWTRSLTPTGRFFPNADVIVMRLAFKVAASDFDGCNNPKKEGAHTLPLHR
jgi:hypothetical protein